jgi:hypothetical protein
MSKLKLAALFAASVCTAPVAAQTLEPAGQVLWSFGVVERIGADGAAKPLAKGDPVFEGDVIRSASGSHAQLVMSDEALIAVRADSSVKLTQYRYPGREDGSERALIELLKGGLRSVTGAIGRSNKENYQLKNEMHVIGIRGTDHETYATERGTYNRVTMGGTYLESSGARVDLLPGETGFASMQAGAAPSRLERTPEFMHLAALSTGNSGPKPRGYAASDDRRLQAAEGVSASAPVAAPASATAIRALPIPAFGVGNNRGGRCDGPCSDPLRSNGRGRFK